MSSISRSGVSEAKERRTDDNILQVAEMLIETVHLWRLEVCHLIGVELASARSNRQTYLLLKVLRNKLHVPQVVRRYKTSKLGEVYDVEMLTQVVRHTPDHGAGHLVENRLQACPSAEKARWDARA